ncbi:MAG: AAA family ATPase [Legionellales bacterium]|nr:AAA family ATPase [Legionellales bacterium]
MSKVIAITNQKGGVGKTTSAINLCASLAHMRKSVLLIDLDPQGNATMGSGVDKLTLTASVNQVLLGEKTLPQVKASSPAGFDVIPANSDLTEAEITLINHAQRTDRLKQALAPILSAYDFVIIDCPPSLNVLTINALIAADTVLIPMQCEYYALEGLAALLDTIRQIQQTANPALQIEGILRTMYDPRSRLTTEVSAQLVEHFQQKVYRTVIPRNVKLAEAPSHGLPALLYLPSSPGAAAYLLLAGELLRRQASFATLSAM